MDGGLVCVTGSYSRELAIDFNAATLHFRL